MRARRPALRTLTSTPARDGFRMPAEFERHSGCWMLWPERPDNWRAGAKPAQAAFAAVAAAIAARRAGHGRRVRGAVSQRARAAARARVRVVEMTSNDAWMRDCGPTFVVDAQGPAPRRRLDIQRLGRTVRRVVLSLGPGRRGRAKGARDRGRRSLPHPSCSKAAPSTSTARAPASPPRSACSIRTAIPVSTRADIEELLRRYLGVSTVIWLERGCLPRRDRRPHRRAGMLHRPGHVALTWTEDRKDPQYEISRDACERLRQAPRCARAPAHGPQDPPAGAAVHDRRGGGGRRCARRHASARPAIGCPPPISISTSRTGTW